MFTLVMKL